jgi:16S rRNA (guanine1207-N2)-methyltransferase
MSQQTHLLSDVVQLAPHERVLVLNSAADPFVARAAPRLSAGTLTLAEDNVASLHGALQEIEHSTPRPARLQQVALHEYSSLIPAASVDTAIMNILFQPNNSWILYALQIADFALEPGGLLYVQGARDRGILSVARRMQAIFGNVETLAISKGQRVVRSRKLHATLPMPAAAPETATRATTAPADVSGADDPASPLLPLVFADGRLDEGTALLIDALEVLAGDQALDLGCGAGFIGLHIARLATLGHVTLLDASLVSVAVAQSRVAQSGLSNASVLPSDGAQAVAGRFFDLVVTNPPFHQGGIQTTAIAERFIREAAHVLRQHGRFYLVANRFLKYEPCLFACFKKVETVGGNSRYKVLRAVSPH